MELPNRQTKDGLTLWKNEIIRFKVYLEQKFHVAITEEHIRNAVKIQNEGRVALKRLYELMRLDPAPMTGQELFSVLYGSTFKPDRSKIPGEVNAIADRVEKEYAEGKMLEKKPRILVTGCPIGGATEKVIKAIEDNGGVVVTFGKLWRREISRQTGRRGCGGYLRGNRQEIFEYRVLCYDSEPESY